MDFISNQREQIQEMLLELGFFEIDQLFSTIPSSLKLPPPTGEGLSEYEGRDLMESIAGKNRFQEWESYLGAGAYEHYVPALVALCGKSEFRTSYTPYQPEASQGMLQAIFEFQSAICALTGMDVANASVYDGASACGEALLMALRFYKERKRVLVAQSVNPRYQKVMAQYLANKGIELVIIPFLSNGSLDLAALEREMVSETAAILVQSPNFFGIIENLREVQQLAKKKNVLSILCANPLAYGLFQSAGELGIDIAVGDCQPIGLSLNFGGPYAGYMAARQELARQLPGRIVGETKDLQGNRGFVLTMQAREQHIRREKATSNICTNQALAALASSISILWYGKEGIRELALTNYQRAAYLREHLGRIPGIQITHSAPFFNEFAVQFSNSIEEVVNHFQKEGIEPGFNLEKNYPQYPRTLLVAVTETKSQKQLDRYLKIASKVK